MHISVKLRRNRSVPGELTLLSDSGVVLMRAPCLGKADNQRAAAEGNPRRDPLKPYGDTPTGFYGGARAVKQEPPHPRLGRWVIPLVGVGGDALDARKLRTGLAIHAGHGNGRLVPTYGCIRLQDDHMEALVVQLSDDAATIAVEETEDA